MRNGDAYQHTEQSEDGQNAGSVLRMDPTRVRRTLIEAMHARAVAREARLIAAERVREAAALRRSAAALRKHASNSSNTAYRTKPC